MYRNLSKNYDAKTEITHESNKKNQRHKDEDILKFPNFGGSHPIYFKKNLTISRLHARVKAGG